MEERKREICSHKERHETKKRERERERERMNNVE